MRSLRLVAAVLFLLAASWPTVAQTTSGSIAGSVQDPQGAAIVNAAVTATDQAKQVSFATSTDAEGRFAFAQL